MQGLDVVEDARDFDIHMDNLFTRREAAALVEVGQDWADQEEACAQDTPMTLGEEPNSDH